MSRNLKDEKKKEEKNKEDGEVLLTLKFDLEGVDCVSMRIVKISYWDKIKVVLSEHDIEITPYGCGEGVEFHGKEFDSKRFLKEIKAEYNEKKIESFKTLFGETFYTGDGLLSNLFDKVDEFIEEKECKLYKQVLELLDQYKKLIKDDTTDFKRYNELSGLMRLELSFNQLELLGGELSDRICDLTRNEAEVSLIPSIPSVLPSPSPIDDQKKEDKKDDDINIDAIEIRIDNISYIMTTEDKFAVELQDDNIIVKGCISGYTGNYVFTKELSGKQIERTKQLGFIVKI